jgi:hypothetical protein
MTMMFMLGLAILFAGRLKHFLQGLLCVGEFCLVSGHVGLVKVDGLRWTTDPLIWASLYINC